MLLHCKRDRLKETRISYLSNNARTLLSLLNQHNIQHFTFNTLTDDIVFTKHGRTSTLPMWVGVNAFIIDSLCTISNKNTEVLKLIDEYKPSMNTPDFSDDTFSYILPTKVFDPTTKVFVSTQVIKSTISRELINFILVNAGIASVQEAEKLLTESKLKKADLEQKIKALKQRLANQDY